MAGQHGDGVLELLALHANADQLRLGSLQLRPRCHHVGTRRRACTVLVGDNLQGTSKRIGGFAQQLLQRILGPQIEIVGRQRGLRRQFGIRKVASTDLRTGNVAFDLASHTAPHVQIPGSVALDAVNRGGATAAAAGATNRAGRYATACQAAATERTR